MALTACVMLRSAAASDGHNYYSALHSDVHDNKYQLIDPRDKIVL